MSKKALGLKRHTAHLSMPPNGVLTPEENTVIQYETVVLSAEDGQMPRNKKKPLKVRLPLLGAGDYRVTVRQIGSNPGGGQSRRLRPNRLHLKALKKGAQSWNDWRRKNHKVLPNLRGASLPRGFDLYKADLSEADLTGASLEDANLSRAILYSSRLVAANLKGANLHGAQLDNADLSKANLAGAELVAASLTGATLTGTEFRNCLMGSTSLNAIDLSETKGLDSVRHVGPSFLGTDAIYLSRGNISDTFLRGAGVPDGFINHVKSIALNPIEYYSCFISYSNKDKVFAERLYTDLQNKHVRVWFFPEDAKWGRGVWESIDEPIKGYDKLIVICSEDSLQSRPVLREVERALLREDSEHRNILFPIRIDQYVFEKWKHPLKADVLNKVVGDFRQWRTNIGYQRAFKRLLDSITTDGEGKRKRST